MSPSLSYVAKQVAEQLSETAGQRAEALDELGSLYADVKRVAAGDWLS